MPSRQKPSSNKEEQHTHTHSRSQSTAVQVLLNPSPLPKSRSHKHSETVERSKTVRPTVRHGDLRRLLQCEASWHEALLLIARYRLGSIRLCFSIVRTLSSSSSSSRHHLFHDHHHRRHHHHYHDHHQHHHPHQNAITNPIINSIRNFLVIIITIQARSRPSASPPSSSHVGCKDLLSKVRRLHFRSGELKSSRRRRLQSSDSAVSAQQRPRWAKRIERRKEELPKGSATLPLGEIC